MTWEDILPEAPISSLLAFGLVVGCVLPTSVVTMIALWRDRRFILAGCIYLLSLVIGVNALMAYSYAPERYVPGGSQSSSAMLTSAAQWVFANAVVMLVGCAVAFAVAIVLGMGMRKRISLSYLWLATALILVTASNLYGYYALGAYALAHNKVPPTPVPGWLEVLSLGVAGIFILGAAVFWLWPATAAWLFQLLSWWSLKWLGLRMPLFHFERRKGRDDPMQHYARQQFLPYTRFHVERVAPLPYQSIMCATGPLALQGDKIWRAQRRRWRRSFWRECWRTCVGVTLYNLQFTCPPQPPKYEYYALEDFYR